MQKETVREERKARNKGKKTGTTVEIWNEYKYGKALFINYRREKTLRLAERKGKAVSWRWDRRRQNLQDSWHCGLRRMGWNRGCHFLCLGCAFVLHHTQCHSWGADTRSTVTPYVEEWQAVTWGMELSTHWTHQLASLWFQLRWEALRRLPWRQCWGCEY